MSSRYNLDSPEIQLAVSYRARQMAGKGADSETIQKWRVDLLKDDGEIEGAIAAYKDSLSGDKTTEKLRERIHRNNPNGNSKIR